MQTIHEAVAGKLSNSSETVKQTIINKIVDIEVTNRVNMLTKAFEKIESFTKNLQKINKDDIVTYQNGEKVTTMSKARFDEIEKLKQTIEELEKVSNTALADNTSESFTKLSEKLNKNGGDKETSTKFDTQEA